MKRPMTGISAALAIAIARQADDIIADAKAECARRYPAGPVPAPSGQGARSPESEHRRELDAAAARLWTARRLGEALRPEWDGKEPGAAAESDAASARGERRGFLKRLLGRLGSASRRAGARDLGRRGRKASSGLARS
jgi:hypothetical protein